MHRSGGSAIAGTKPDQPEHRSRTWARKAQIWRMLCFSGSTFCPDAIRRVEPRHQTSDTCAGTAASRPSPNPERPCSGNFPAGRAPGRPWTPPHRHPRAYPRFGCLGGSSLQDADYGRRPRPSRCSVSRFGRGANCGGFATRSDGSAQGPRASAPWPKPEPTNTEHIVRIRTLSAMSEAQLRLIELRPGKGRRPYSVRRSAWSTPKTHPNKHMRREMWGQLWGCGQGEPVAALLKHSSAIPTTGSSKTKCRSGITKFDPM